MLPFPLRRLLPPLLVALAFLPALAARSALAENPPVPESEPRTPAASLAALRLPAGFEAKIVAAEPLVLDPVAFDWDAQGRLWVVEMADYPLGLDNENASGGRVRILEDRDGDGLYDHATLFAEGLNFPTGILAWRGGAIVTAAPDILYLEDGDGDGHADVREVLYTGLSEGNQQLRANGLRWGLDNWVHVAAGGHHGKHAADTVVKSLRAGSEVAVGSRDFRIRPDDGGLEPESGPTQFGRNRDDWGHWFGTQNSHPLWHFALPDRYLRRNPYFAPPDGRVQLPGGSNPPVHPASPPEKRYHSFQQAGRYTSACSGEIHRGGRLFPQDVTMAFICEPFHNLVQLLELDHEGASFSGKRVGGEGEPDFFASEDRWCRPVMVRGGPDGAIWVADMYRYMIEHPHWLPQEGKDELLPHYRLGEDRGRIYRIDRVGAAQEPIPALGSLDAASLVSLLGSPKGWIRDKAHQIILWRGAEADTLDLLLEAAASAESPLARLHALCVLEGLGELPRAEEALLAALRHPHPGLRENALRLLESLDSANLRAAALSLVDDSDAKVRLQLAFLLGEQSEAEAGAALSRLLARDPEDPLLAAAALSSALPHLAALAADAPDPVRRPLIAMSLAAGEGDALSALLAPLLDGDPGSRARRWRIYGELLDAAEARGIDPAPHLRRIGDGSPASLSKACERLLAEALACLEEEGESLQDHLAAASLLARTPENRKAAHGFFAASLSDRIEAAEWTALLAASAAAGTEGLPGQIFALWPRLTPSQRGASLDALFGRSAWTRELLSALEGGTVKAAEFDPARRQRLLSYPDKEIKAQADRLLSGGSGGSRAEVVDRYRPALSQPGDPAKGHLVYQRACASCHRRGGEGIALGPDLETVAAHEPEKLLVNILDPNLDIQPGYHAYVATLKGGEQLFGLLASESGAGLTFKLPDGSSRALVRDEIASLQATGLSLMPEGLDGAIGVEEMADLIAWLRSR